MVIYLKATDSSNGFGVVSDTACERAERATSGRCTFFRDSIENCASLQIVRRNLAAISRDIESPFFLSHFPNNCATVA